MLPEMSRTRTMSMPSVLILLSLRPNCGRANAATTNRSVAPRNRSNNAGPSAAQRDDNDRAVATEENFKPPCRAKRCSHQSHSGSTSKKSKNHGLANFMLVRPPPAPGVAYRAQTSRLPPVPAACPIAPDDVARILRGQIPVGMRRVNPCVPGPTYCLVKLRTETPPLSALAHASRSVLRGSDGRCPRVGCKTLPRADFPRATAGARESRVRKASAGEEHWLRRLAASASTT